MLDEGYIYIISNEAMPNLYKIGMTKKDDIRERISALQTSGVLSLLIVNLQ
jgi:hypothetical protein